MTAEPANSELSVSRRAAVRRTAWILAACAVASYLLFLYTAMSGK
jgi:hypothetical protein